MKLVLLVILLISFNIGNNVQGQTTYDQNDNKSSNLTIHTNLDHYAYGQNITVTYHVAYLFNDTKLSIHILNSLGSLIVNKTFPAMENGTWIVSTENSSWSVPGNYTVLAQYGSSDQKMHFYFGGYGNAVTIHFVTPLQQIRSGVEPKDVTCKNTLQLVMKMEDGSPACVKPDTAKVLIERGWARLS
ncbi:MAG TPA: hypothetical protein VFX64_01930 [Candidatus Nitrosotalea sp.]|nr:hypothetical protein [Candidatus Nitrosotalea sp.]